MLNTDFAPVDCSGRGAYLDCFRRLPERAADYTFTNLWAWASEFGLEWAFRYGHCWIRQTRMVEQPCLWAPVGDWDSLDFTVLPELRAGTLLLRTPESLCERLRKAFGKRLEVEATPGQWEYVYENAALLTLSGNVLHKKKSHLNWFRKTYGDDFRELTPGMLPLALDLEGAWLAANGDEASKALRAESRALRRTLHHWTKLPEVLGGALFADGDMVAFCVGEALDEQTMVVHFEKALPGVRGAYQAVNWHFVRTAGQQFVYTNREQDGDDPGLRQAKRSYAPLRQLRKDTVRILY